MWTVVGAVFIVGGLVFGGVSSMVDEISSGEFSFGAEASDDDAEITYRELGSSSTVTIDAYDLEANTLTEVYPKYTILDSAGGLVVDNTNSNSTNSFVGETWDLYITGNSYYGEPLENFEIANERPIVRVDAHAIAAEANLASVIYDSTGATALGTTGINATDSYDYALDMSADETTVVYYKLDNNQANKEFRWKCLAIAHAGFDDVSVESPGWSEVSLSDELDDVPPVLTQRLTATALTNEDWKSVYCVDNAIVMDEFDEHKIKIKLEQDSTAPGSAGTTEDHFAVMAIDEGYSKGDDGTVSFGWFDAKSHTNHSQVGMAEVSNSPSGKTGGAAVLIS